MSTSFILTLDTTAPAGVTLDLNSGAVFTGVVDVTATVGTTDPVTTGYQVKFWGDVEGAAIEADALWVGYADTLPLVLTAGDGLKTVNLRMRDDVGNESIVATDTITLDTAAPIITITVDPTPLKISKVPGWNINTFSFAASEDLAAWTVRVVADEFATHDQGTEIPLTNGSIATTGGALAASTNQQVTITGADLEAASPGDGPKAIKVFGVDGSGVWST